jgi:hypothetical protein
MLGRQWSCDFRHHIDKKHLPAIGLRPLLSNRPDMMQGRTDSLGETSLSEEFLLREGLNSALSSELFGRRFSNHEIS